MGSCFINHNYSLFSIFRFGDVSLQESINQENFELLKEYYTVFMEKMPPDCKYASYQKKKKKTHNNNNFLINNSLGEDRHKGQWKEKARGGNVRVILKLFAPKRLIAKVASQTPASLF